MIVELGASTVERTHYGCVTRFDDGSFVNSCFHPQDPHYHVVSNRCGYADDLHAYCFEHEVAHCFLSEKLFFRPSPVLWALAHGRELEGPQAALEEVLVQTFQRWLRAAEQPIVAGVDWFGLRDDARALLGSI